MAGGRKDVKLGDVVIATKIYDYESGKAGENFKPRPITHHSSYRILQRARAVARKAHWLKRVQEPSWDKAPFWERPPKAFIKPIASGTKVIGSTLSQAAKLLDSTCGDALAAEMEGYGFLETVFVHTQVEALVVRGISDLIDDKDQSDAVGFQSIAAGHASAFTFEVLSTLWGRPLSRSDWGDFAGQVNALRYRLTALSSNSLTNKQVRGEVKEICLQLSTLGDQLYLELGKEPEKSTNLAQQFKIKEIIEQAQIVIITVDDAARDNVLRSYRPLGITLQNALTELMLSLEELEQALY